MKRHYIVIILAILILGSSVPGAAKEAKKAVNLSVLEAWQMLAQEPKTTFMVDVRTRAEYALLGHPPGAYNIPWRMATTDFQIKGGPYSGGKAPMTGYQLSPKPNPDFVEVVKSLFKPSDRLIILSAKGDQGAEAADALFAAGFKKVFCIRHGFSGDPLRSQEQDELAQKFSPYFGLSGRVNGWQYWGLPTTMEMNPRYIYPPDLKRMQNQK
ncbi:MAG: rhodanese-like domain-containing protein [Desulfarculaceae bacterium]|jgi:rhodanese-related sulfurtransferase